MENLVRIEFDPRRGGEIAIDFLRLCIRVANWPSEEVEIWSSDDGGDTWEKLESGSYRASYYPASTGLLYVSLLEDITSGKMLAFFHPGGQPVGVGWTLTKHGQILVGCAVEGIKAVGIPSGWDVGSVARFCIPTGATVEGGLKKNTSVGFGIKCPSLTNVPGGCSIAAPVDGDVGAAFDIGTVAAAIVTLGGTILGLGEFSAGFLVLDSKTAGAMCAEYAWRKQKAVILSGTAPEELD